MLLKWVEFPSQCSKFPPLSPTHCPQELHILTSPDHKTKQKQKRQGVKMKFGGLGRGEQRGGSSSLPRGGGTWLGETPQLEEGHGVAGSGSVLWLWQRSQMSLHELPVLLCLISPQCPQLGVLRGVCYPLDEGRDEPQKDFNEAFRPGFEPRPSLPGPGLFPQYPQSGCPPGPTPVLPHRVLHLHVALTTSHRA